MVLSARIVSPGLTISLPSNVPPTVTLPELRQLVGHEAYSRAATSLTGAEPTRRIRGGDLVVEGDTLVEYVDQRAAAVKDYFTGGSFGAAANIDAAVAAAIADQVLPWGKALLIHPGDHTITDPITVGLGRVPLRLQGYNGAMYAEPGVTQADKDRRTRILWGGSSGENMVTVYGGGWAIENIWIQATQLCNAIVEWVYDGTGASGTATQARMENVLLYGNDDPAARYASYCFLAAAAGNVGNFEYFHARNVGFAGGKLACVKCASTSNQAKDWLFDNCAFAGSDGYGVEFVTGSFKARSSKGARLDAGLFYVGGATDVIELTGVDIEDCARLLVTGGPADAVQDIHINGVRFAMDGLHADGAIVRYLLRGTLTIQGLGAEATGDAATARAQRRRAHIQVASAVPVAVNSFGNTYPNLAFVRPMTGYSGQGTVVNSFGDKCGHIDDDGDFLVVGDPYRHVEPRTYFLPRLQARVAGSVAAFQACLDARDFYDLLEDGDTVTLWKSRDFELTSFDLDQGANAQYQRFGLNGMPCVYFNGTNAWLGRNSGGTAVNSVGGDDKPYTLVVLGKVSTLSNTIVYEFDGSGADREGAWGDGGNNISYIRGSAPALGGYGAGTWDGNVHCYAFVCSGTTKKLFIDGVQVGTTQTVNTAAISVDWFTLAAHRSTHAAATAFAEMWVSRLEVYGDALSDAEVLQLYRDLRRDWNGAY